MTEDTQETQTEEQTEDQTGEEQEQADAGSGDELAVLREELKGLKSGISEERRKRQLIEQEFQKLNQQTSSEEDDTYITKAEAAEIARRNWEQWSSQQEQTRQNQAFSRKLQEAQDQYKDVDLSELVNDATLPVSESMAEVLKASDNPAGLLVHLHKNRQEAQKLYNLSPTAAARELGRIEAKLDSPPSKTVTSAPEPIENVGDRGKSSTKYRDDMSAKEYEQWVKEQRGGSVWPKGRVGI